MAKLQYKFVVNFQSPPGECAKATKYAISVGYRHIDAAWLYGNEKEVGEGVREAIKEGK